MRQNPAGFRVASRFLDCFYAGSAAFGVLSSHLVAALFQTYRTCVSYTPRAKRLIWLAMRLKVAYHENYCEAPVLPLKFAAMQQWSEFIK